MKGQTTMPQEPHELAANEWGAITYYPQWDTLELKWGPQTRSMTDDGFKQTLQIMADHGLKVRPRYMIIDATQFSHSFGAGTLACRAGLLVPLYNDPGVVKFRPLTPPVRPSTPVPDPAT